MTSQQRGNHISQQAWESPETSVNLCLPTACRPVRRLRRLNARQAKNSPISSPSFRRVTPLLPSVRPARIPCYLLPILKTATVCPLSRPGLSGIPLLTNSRSHRRAIPPAFAAPSRLHRPKRDAAIRNRLRRFPVPGISPSSRCRDCSDTTNASNPSLLQDDSVGSLMTTSSESSSFTLPPFQTSTDSNHSLCDLDNTNEAFIDTGGRGYYGDDNGHEDDNGDEDEEEEMASIHHNATAPLMEDSSHKSNILDRISPLISLEPWTRKKARSTGVSEIPARSRS
ncbi:hypothetical protein Btru_066395 [Bulinus truncatus]|nr:hypothetical protein Btru_066395 [Bulinus truncatus]